jgi:hypothetical protein
LLNMERMATVQSEEPHLREDLMCEMKHCHKLYAKMKVKETS